MARAQPRPLLRIVAVGVFGRSPPRRPRKETSTAKGAAYAIDELGLSAEAARNLYSGKASADVFNRLLESPRFAELTYILEQYFNDTIAAGYAAQNQMYATLSTLTRKGQNPKLEKRR